MEIVSLTARHVREILARNLSEGAKMVEGVSPDDMIKSYLSAGRAAYCVVDRAVPVLAGGIINLQWRRGEAWILSTSLARDHGRAILKMIKDTLPKLAVMYGYRRVQATSVLDNARLFSILGFELEAPELRYFGPAGETARLYARFFEVH